MIKINKKSFYILLVSASFLMIIAFLYFLFTQNPGQSPSLQTIAPTNNAVITSYRWQSVSPNLSYRIGIVTQTENMSSPCVIFATSLEGNHITTPQFPHNLTCTFDSSGSLSTPILNWISDDTFFLEKIPGWVEVYQLKNSAVPVYSYDPSLYQIKSLVLSKPPVLLLQDKNQKYFLSSSPQKNTALNLPLDSGYEVAKIIPSQLKSGFFFYSRKLVDDSGAVDIFFISSTTGKNLKSFSSPLSSLPPIDCGEYHFIDNDQIPLLAPGCFDVPTTLLNDQGFIELKTN